MDTRREGTFNFSSRVVGPRTSHQLNGSLPSAVTSMSAQILLCRPLPLGKGCMETRRCLWDKPRIAYVSELADI